MSKFIRAPICLAVFAFVACLPRAAQARDDKGGDFGKDDKQFLSDALQGTQVQASLSRLAREHSSNEHVKRFAEETTGGLDKLEKELRQRADEHHVAVDAKANKHQKETDERLSKLKGSDFDVQYMSEQVATLQSLGDMFDREARHGENSELRQFAERKGQDVREMLDRAKDLYKNVKENEKGK